MGFVVEDGVPLVIHNASSSRNDRFEIRAEEPLEANHGEVRFTFVPDDAQLLSPGTMQIYVGDRLIASGRIERVSFLTMGPGETMDIGDDTGRRVMDYPAGPEFSGLIEEVIISKGN